MAFLLLASLALAQVERIDRDERCVECHVDEADVVKASVHGAAKVGCVSCHGADDVNLSQKSGNPHRKTSTFRMYRRQNLAEDCGSCHIAELDAMRPTGHFKATKWGNDQPRAMRGCVACHAHHETARAERGPIIKSCQPCHVEEPRIITDAAEWSEGMDALSKRLGEAAAALARFERRPGINARPLKEAHAAGNAALAEGRIAQHGLGFKAMEADRSRAAGSLDAAYNRLTSDERAFGRRWVWLMPFLALVLTSMILVRTQSRRLTS